MRAADVQQLGMFSYRSVEDRIPADHPVRTLRMAADAILLELDPPLSTRSMTFDVEPAWDRTSRASMQGQAPKSVRTTRSSRFHIKRHRRQQPVSATVMQPSRMNGVW